METTSTFEGCDEMVRVVNDAVRRPTVEQLTGALKDGLSELIKSGRLALPPELKQPCNGHYARRLLYKSEELGYVVVAMVWGPKQGTPLHDHAGTWCVEGVLEGEIEVTQYDLQEDAGPRLRFERQETLHTERGAAGSLIPPFDYHTIANARGDASAITLHVYGEEMNHCTVFEPVADQGAGDWYEKKSKPLSYDA
jgi:3-mercaptopropionate dioxygenase